MSHCALYMGCLLFICLRWVLVVVCGLSLWMWDLSSPSRDQALILCFGGQTVNHWTTREDPGLSYLIFRIAVDIGTVISTHPLAIFQMEILRLRECKYLGPVIRVETTVLGFEIRALAPHHPIRVLAVSISTLSRTPFRTQMKVALFHPTFKILRCEMPITLQVNTEDAESHSDGYF